jgi:hypothetical protein
MTSGSQVPFTYLSKITTFLLWYFVHRKKLHCFTCIKSAIFLTKKMQYKSNDGVFSNLLYWFWIVVLWKEKLLWLVSFINYFKLSIIQTGRCNIIYMIKPLGSQKANCLSFALPKHKMLKYYYHYDDYSYYYFSYFSKTIIKVIWTKTEANILIWGKKEKN